jgi:uroporphyrinogen-III synthase
LLTQYIMKDNNIVILSTRPLDDALIAKAARNKITIDAISFINIEKMVSQEIAGRIETLSKEKATVVFTSTNALNTAVELLPVNAGMPEWNIYCLGGATFTTVKENWPARQVAFTGKNATELAERIISDGLKEIVFFCGHQRRDELPLLLAKHGIHVEELAVYRTLETPVKVETDYQGILFFSPSAVQSYFSLNKAHRDATFFALGNTTADAIKQFAINNIIVSDFPRKELLVDKAINFFAEQLK